MKLLFTLALTYLLCWQVSFGQQNLYTGNGQVTFSAGAPLELIKGTSQEIKGSINPETGKVYFEIPIKSFQFANSLMQERFNDKYMQADRHPKATFNGRVTEFSHDSKEVTAYGTLTIHGITRKRSIKGTLTRDGNEFILQTLFTVNTKDHHIESPRLISGLVADEVNVNLRLQLTQEHNTARMISMNQRKKDR